MKHLYFKKLATEFLDQIDDNDPILDEIEETTDLKKILHILDNLNNYNTCFEKRRSNSEYFIIFEEKTELMDMVNN